MPIRTNAHCKSPHKKVWEKTHNKNIIVTWREGATTKRKELTSSIQTIKIIYKKL